MLQNITAGSIDVDILTLTFLYGNVVAWLENMSLTQTLAKVNHDIVHVKNT